MIGKPEIYIYNQALELQGVVDQYTSFQGDRSLWEVGKCELHTTLTDSGAKHLKIGNILVIDRKRAWIIDDVEQQEEETLPLTIRGKQVKGIFAQRLVIPGKVSDQKYFGFDRFPGATQPDAAAETIMKYYVGKHAVSPEDPQRKFPRLFIAADKKRGMKTRWSERFKPLDKTLEDIGEFTGIGWDVLVIPETKQFLFEIIPEVNQISTSEKLVIFSVEFDNLSDLRYRDSIEDLQNIAYIGGAGTDEERLITSIPSSGRPAGFTRREVWFDCGSIQNIDDLIYEGQYRLDKKIQKETLSGNALLSKTFEYMKDWDLGSIVTLRSVPLKIEQTKKITSVKEAWETNQYVCTPIFGNRQKNILDDIKKVEVVT